MFFTGIKAARAARRARRIYELARIESLIAANAAAMEERRQQDSGCRWCVKAEATA